MPQGVVCQVRCASGLAGAHRGKPHNGRRQGRGWRYEPSRPAAAQGQMAAIAAAGSAGKPRASRLCRVGLATAALRTIPATGRAGASRRLGRERRQGSQRKQQGQTCSHDGACQATAMVSSRHPLVTECTTGSSLLIAPERICQSKNTPAASQGPGRIAGGRHECVHFLCVSLI